MDTELTRAQESWRGATYEEVVRQWGPHARTIKLGQGHTWVSEDRQDRGGVRCERTLMFRDGRVIDEQWSGDPALCKRFARR